MSVPNYAPSILLKAILNSVCYQLCYPDEVETDPKLSNLEVQFFNALLDKMGPRDYDSAWQGLYQKADGSWALPRIGTAEELARHRERLATAMLGIFEGHLKMAEGALESPHPRFSLIPRQEKFFRDLVGKTVGGMLPGASEEQKDELRASLCSKVGAQPIFCVPLKELGWDLVKLYVAVTAFRDAHSFLMYRVYLREKGRRETCLSNAEVRFLERHGLLSPYWDGLSAPEKHEVQIQSGSVSRTQRRLPLMTDEHELAVIRHAEQEIDAILDKYRPNPLYHFFKRSEYGDHCATFMWETDGTNEQKTRLLDAVFTVKEADTNWPSEAEKSLVYHRIISRTVYDDITVFNTAL